MQPLITVYTPIDDINSNNLISIYNSLYSQTNHNFNWVIINFGEADFGDQYIAQFSNTKFDVKYYYLPNLYKHEATHFILTNCSSKYILGLDYRFTIHESTISELIYQWTNIEDNNLTDIAEIRAKTEYSNGNLMGKSKFNYSANYTDMTWHEMVLKNSNNYEMLACWDRNKFLDAFNFDDYIKLYGKVDNIPTFILWSSIGLKYKTRYLNRTLKIVIGNHFIDNTKSEKLSNVFGIVYFLNKNIKFFLYNPKYFIYQYYHLSLLSIKLNMPLHKIMKYIEGFFSKLITSTFYIILYTKSKLL